VSDPPISTAPPGSTQFPLFDRRHEVFLEVVTIGPDGNRQLHDKHYRWHVRNLMFLASQPIYWVGDVPGFRNKTEDATWIRATTEAAACCALTGEPSRFSAEMASSLSCDQAQRGRARPREAPMPNRMTDLGSAQTRGTGTAWV
jgi:hypothetical protein